MNKILIPIYFTLMILFFYSALYGDIFSPGKLSWHHEQWDNIDSCTVCHSSDKGVDDNACLKCHDALKLRIDENLGYHKDKKDSCATCHSEHNGRDYLVMRLDFKTFDHKKDADYELLGKHQSVSCEECHPNSDSTSYILGEKNQCINCHESKHDVKYDDSCSVCHTNNNFIEMKPRALEHKFIVPNTEKSKWTFNTKKKNHSQEIKNSYFELKGVHKNLECLQCHENYIFDTNRKNCNDCHIDPHKNELGESCEKCHSETEDKRFSDIAIFNHNDKKFSNFKLDGAHANLDCNECHDTDKQKNDFKYNRSSGFIKYGKNSLTKKELNVRFNFKTPKVKRASSFQLPALSLKYSTTTCIECHTNNEHKDIFGEKGNTCEICHTTDSFKIDRAEIKKDKKLDHFLLSGGLFTIEGKHLKLIEKNRFNDSKNKFDCLICHTKDLKKERISIFGDVSSYKNYKACIICHEDIHDNTLGNNCSECHTDKDLFNNTNALFDHNKIFELKDSHEKLECQECHTDYSFLNKNKIIFRLPEIDNELRKKGVPLNYSMILKPKEIACVKCHEDKHSNELGSDCQKCHSETNWKDLSKFDHDDEKFTKFKYGRKIHEEQECSACHKDYEKGNLSFKIDKHECEDCHAVESTHKMLEYDTTKLDDKYNCIACHTDKETWTEKIKFKHDNSIFDKDSHKNLECYTCHKFNDFLKETDNCLSCHKDFHKGFLPGDCDDCHDVKSWKIPIYRHIGLSFTGSGVHEVMNCNQCHTDEISYRINTPHSSCVDCHLDDFKKVLVKDHYNVSYDCLKCHDESTWKL